MSVVSRAVSGRLSTGFFNLMKRYEDVIGITDVKEAQTRVIQAEQEFSVNQEARRTKSDEIRSIQTQLKEIHVQLDKTSRGEDRYLHLLTEEHAIIKKEKLLIDEFRGIERTERESFTRLSNYLRDSHEKERDRGERTKYWSIIGSAIGALIGIVGTTVNNRLRMRELRSLVVESNDTAKMNTIIKELSDTIQSQQGHVRSFVTDLRQMFQLGQLEVINTSSGESVVMPSAAEGQSNAEVISAIERQSATLTDEMNEVKRLIAVDRGYQVEEGTIVYVGPEMSSLLDRTEKNLEWKMKISTLVNVVLVYGALALAIPIILSLAKGPG